MRADVTGRGVIFEGVIAPGTIAYVDRDWVPPVSGPVPSLTVSGDGVLTWGDFTTELEGDADPDAAAALALTSVAGEAVAQLPPGAVDVVGSGVIARVVRTLIGDGAAQGAGRPSAIVEASGDPAAIVDATRRVADLGSVVLVGEALGRRTDVNLYTDVHVRGLTLVGVPPPLRRPRPPGASRGDIALVTLCRESLAKVGPGTPVPPDALWFAVTT